MKAWKKILGEIGIGLVVICLMVAMIGGNMAFIETCRGLDGLSLEKRITAIEEHFEGKTDSVMQVYVKQDSWWTDTTERVIRRDFILSLCLIWGNRTVIDSMDTFWGSMKEAIPTPQPNLKADNSTSRKP